MSRTGAFEKRLDNSDIASLEGSLPETMVIVLNGRSTNGRTSTRFDGPGNALSAKGLELTNAMKTEGQSTELADRGVVDDPSHSPPGGEYPSGTTAGIRSLPAGAAVQFDIIAATAQ
ncbi:endoribonuclease L-PSP [Natronorubrum sulfidifaciens JCM 14089]|uniref:Endoribonuclease L-PSP n=2 Tax=Natronorubrum sulfidifaciens TaxID=388259 RepID=L9VTZ1_9EURY|nr:endoribonuclease L-PSP [Natronorubrum sulfidifaciens JCM 14089]